MKTYPRVIVGSIVGLLLTCLLPRGIGLAESPDPVALALASTQAQWEEGTRLHAQKQRHIQLEINALPPSGDSNTLFSLQEELAAERRTFSAEQAELHDEAQRLRNALCRTGKAEYCNRVDLDKLAHAVAVAETEDCTTGTGVSRNNCHGIFQCGPTGCEPVAFASKEDSTKAFKELWMRNYGNHFPTEEDARRYVDSDAVEWYQTVTQVYYQ